MSEKKYSDKQEQIARFAKAMGHPARFCECVGYILWSLRGDYE